MHEILAVLADPYAFLTGGHAWVAWLNSAMIVLTVVLVAVAAMLPFPQGRGGITLHGRPGSGKDSTPPGQ